jgi:periplasmic protein TonB
MKIVSHIKSNLKYPEEAVKNKVQGQVVAEFVIDEKGAVTSPVITQGIGSGCDEEALRILSLMPAWTPGTQGGQPVKVKMKLPIVFKLTKE